MGGPPRRMIHLSLKTFLAAAFLAVALLAATVHAHPLAPSLLELREQDGHRVQVLWKISRALLCAINSKPIYLAG